MDAIRAAGDGDVGTGINQQSCGGFCRIGGISLAYDLDGPCSQLQERTRRQILFPNLNQIYTRTSRAGNPIEQESQAFLVIGGKLFAVGYVVKKQASNLTLSFAVQRGITFRPLSCL